MAAPRTRAGGLLVTDARLRELERRWRETGTVEDEAAWLRARVQAGELEQSKLELAGLCGCKAACLAIGVQVRPIPDIRAALDGYGSEQSDEPPPWLADIQRLCGDEAVRRLVLPALRISHSFQGEFVDAVVALEDWLLKPGENERARIRHHLAADGALTRKAAAVAFWHGEREMSGTDLLVVVAQALFLCLYEANGLAAGLEAGADELVPWALGYHDPVRERVEARQEAAGE
jgi:hypothetical protein